MSVLKRTVGMVCVAVGFACLFAQAITFDARDITLYQMMPGEIEGPQNTPQRDRRRGEDRSAPQGGSQDRPRDGTGSPSQDKPQDGGRASVPQEDQRDVGKGGSPQDRQRDGRNGASQGGGKGAGRASGGGQPRGGGANPPPPGRRPGPRAYGGGGDRWETYLLLSAPIPIVSHDYGDDGSFSGAGGGMGFSLYKVHPDSHFALMFRMGLALVGGEFSDDFEDNWDKDESASVGGVTSFYSYFRFGMGGAIEPDREGRFALIPTGGVGVSFTTMSADVTVEEVYAKGVYEDKREKTGLDFTFDVFVDLMAAFMFTNNFGLSASCEVAMNLIGLGGFADVSYAVLPPSLTVTPTVSICLRF